MLNLHGHNSSTSGTASLGANGLSLTQWVRQVAGLKQARVRSRLRGNNLHILFESQPCPSSTAIVPRLVDAFTTTSLEQLLPPNTPQIYRVIVYGRLTDQTTPEWTESFYLNQPVQKSASGQEASEADKFQQQNSTNTPLQETNLAKLSIAEIIHLACQGEPAAIARYLSHTFSNTGTSVRARVETIEGERLKDEGERRKANGEQESLETKRQEKEDGLHSDAALQSPSTPHSPLPTPHSAKRLIIACESAYCPDPLLLAEPIAQRLRELELQNFLDAVVFGQVNGETRPEWVLRIDLTPPTEILREWAHWGDVQAITCLLNRSLAPYNIEVSALLKDSTLHLNCQSTKSSSPDKATTIVVVNPLLSSLSPQGISAATIYGLTGASSNQEVPAWVDWLNLPAASQPELALSTLELAHQGDLNAIAFLLTRLLNPSLDAKLATGGIRVQLRQKGDLLHIMTDGPTCPQQAHVGISVARFLQPLNIPGIAGVRIYGRRAGQKRPLWSYGLDFSRREHRLVPEATPEFAVSDAYVSDLLSPPGALVLRSDLPPNDWRSILGRFLEGTIEQIQRSLIRTQLFVPLEVESANTNLAVDPEVASPQSNHYAVKTALVWGTVGLLLVVQSDWILGQWLQPPPRKEAQPTQVPPQPAPSERVQPTPQLLPNLSLRKRNPGDKSAFNSTGFTQPGSELLTDAPGPTIPPETNTPIAPANLPASPLQSKASLSGDRAAFPTFNSRQLDEKIALYKQLLAEQGPPDVLIIGSSRALRGVDPGALRKALAEQGYPGVTVFNFGVNGATAQVVDLVIQQILPPDKLPKLIVWADGARAFNSGRVDITQNGIVASEGYRSLLAGNPPIAGAVVAQAPNQTAAADDTQSTADSGESGTSSLGRYQAMNQELDKRLGALSLAYTQRNQLKTLVRDSLASLLPKDSLTGIFGGAIASKNLSDATSPAASAANSPDVLSGGQGIVDVDGFLPLSNQFNPATYYQKYSRVPGDYDSDYESFGLEGKQTDALMSLVQFTQARQIPLVFVNLPLTNDYLDPPRKQHEAAFQQHMLRLSTQLGFVYRDLNQILAAQPAYFSDPSHLNRYGAYEVSRRLAQDVMVPWSSTR